MTSPKSRPARKRRRRSGLADALFTATRQRVLGLLLGQPERTFTLSELIRLADVGTGAVQRELERLGQAGIVNTRSVDGRRQVQANTASPIFAELRSIVEKTSGVEAQLRRALESAAPNIRLALLFGSVAKGADTARSDIDVLIVSDHLTLEAAFATFAETERRLGRKVSPTIYTSEEFVRRRQAGQPFLTKILSGEHIVLVGSVDGLAAREPR